MFTAPFSSSFRGLVVAAGLMAALGLPVRGQPATTPLVTNAAMEIDANGDGWPDGWVRPSEGGTWESEGDNRFIRIAVPRPGAFVMLYSEVAIPPGTGSIEFTWRQRIQQLTAGDNARIVMEFLDAQGETMSPGVRTPFFHRNTDGWEAKTGRLVVPPGARAFTFTPSLLRVKGGAFDLDDLVITAVPAPEPVAVAAAAAPALVTPPPAPVARPPQPATPAPSTLVNTPITLGPDGKSPPMLRVQGNRLVTVQGEREVWLQGVNVPSLEWSVKGESVLKSITVAIDDWKANVIRLPVKADHWFGKGVKWNTQKDGGQSYRDLIDEAITLASSKGAYVVLDLHHYRAPRPEHLTFWTEAATRYKDHPAVLFDLLNEPHGTSWDVWRDGGFLEEKKKAGDEDAFLTPEEKLHNKRGYQSPGMQKLLDTVRATGAKNIVVIGGLDYAYDLTGIVSGYALNDRSGHGIMYASHVYPWKKGWQKRFLDAAAKHPILLGEVGGDANKMKFIKPEHQENVETWVPAMLGLIQQHKLNWTGWCFHPKASPRMLADWDYTPTSFWGQPAKDALAGKRFPPPDRLR